MEITMTDLVERLRGIGDRDAGRPFLDLHEAADMIERLRALVKDLADDLEAEIKGRNPAETLQYPSEQRRYERDMVNVYEARRALEPKP